ncbi:MAG: GcrA cell cycle regulator [Rhodobacteraceae bacterium]|nr:GcrA cell cycle regulator [Paracoccaceae bacterium]
MSWTDDRVERLRKMWDDTQKTTREISRELGGVTRNAVIGKAHRLGLPNRIKAAKVAKEKAAREAAKEGADKDGRPAAKPGPKTESARPVAKDAPDAAPFRKKTIIPADQPLPPQPSANEISPEAIAKVNEVEKHARRIKLMELTECTCKWPIGDPATEDLYFCGLPVQQGKPYCEAHVSVAVQPTSSRRDRRR